MPPAAGGPLDRWRVVGIPRWCRTHARQPRAPTPTTYTQKASSGSRSAEYVNQLSTSSVYFLVRYVGHLLFRPFSASLILFVFGLSLPATAVLCFSTEGIPSPPPCLNGRAAVRALFNGRRILRNYATTLARLRSMPLIGFSR